MRGKDFFEGRQGRVVFRTLSLSLVLKLLRLFWNVWSIKAELLPRSETPKNGLSLLLRGGIFPLALRMLNRSRSGDLEDERPECLERPDMSEPSS